MTDEYGVQRHILPKQELERLYRSLDNFVADLTVEEFRNDEDAINRVKALIHQRIRTS